MKDKIAQLKISNISKLSPYQRDLLDDWIKKTRKELKNNYEIYSDSCEFNLMK